MNHLLTKSSIWNLILTFIRIYLGWTWFLAGFEKLTGESFSAAGFIKGALAKTSGPHPAVQAWWAEFLQDVAVPNMGLFNNLVPWGELLVGLALLFGVLTKFSVLMGMAMNFSYLLSGSTSTNPQMLLLEIIVFIHGTKAAKLGLDYWVMPKLNAYMASIRKSGPITQHSESA